MKLWSKLLNWFYTTPLGNLYFEFLLWKDRRNSRSELRYLSPKEVSQIIRQYSLMAEGVKEVKKKVNELVSTKSANEYNKVLSEIEDMVQLAERDPESPQAKFASVLRQMGDYKKVKDIESVTDRAKMIDKRIQDMYELQAHVERRTLLREIRKAKKNGNIEQVTKLEQEWKQKYGRS